MKWWKQADRVAMLDQLVSWKAGAKLCKATAVLGSFSCSSACVDVSVWVIDISSGNTYWILIMNVLAKQWELHTPASPRNWVSHHLTNVCPVFNCFPAPLEKTREDFWCAWRLESHLSWLAVTSHGDSGFQAACLKLCSGISFSSQTQGWNVATEPTTTTTKHDSESIHL